MDERNNNSQKYDAFISYTHKDLDVFVAETIHKKLERYHIPKKLRNKSGERRFSRIFRDKEELAVSPDLSENICRALENSEYLIVLCSPEAKESVWVQREIEYFLEWHDHDHILPVLLKGEPSEAFPQILCEKQISKTDESGKETVTTVALEPLSADVRGANRKVVFRKCGTELLRLVAVMLGCSYDELKQRHREYVMKKVVAALSLALILSGEPVKKEEYSELFDQDIRLRFCAEKCFDKALITRNPADEDALVELLNSINSDMKNILQDYFADRYFYFSRYSKRLAQELARIYNWPENNDKRRNEVTK